MLKYQRSITRMKKHRILHKLKLKLCLMLRRDSKLLLTRLKEITSSLIQSQFSREIFILIRASLIKLRRNLIKKSNRLKMIAARRQSKAYNNQKVRPKTIAKAAMTTKSQISTVISHTTIPTRDSSNQSQSLKRLRSQSQLRNHK